MSLREAYQCHGSNVGPMGTVRTGNGGVTGGVPFIIDERERVPRLASSSRMQRVASTVTTGTGQRMDPDTESLVVT